MGASTVVGFKAPNNSVYYRPVQGEGATELMGSVLSDGTGVLTWRNNTQVRAAIVPPGDWLKNDVVDALDVVTVMTRIYSGNLRGHTSWSDGMNHYVMIHETIEPAGAWIYRSTDGAQTWSVLSSIGTRSGDHWNDYPPSKAPPLKVDGRWHIRYGHDQREISDDNLTRQGWAYTTDGAATWSGVNTASYGRFNNGRAASPHAVQDPTTGQVIWYRSGDNGSRRHMYYSGDNGGSWATVSYASAPAGHHFHPFVDDGTYVYAFRGTSVVRTTTPLDYTSWEVVGVQGGGDYTTYFRYGEQDYYFDGDRIWTSVRRRPTVGYIGFR